MNKWATEAFKPCAIIPVYNHWLVLKDVVMKLHDAGLPVLLIDDGSDSSCVLIMEEIVRDFSDVQLIRRQHNGGKGAAVKDGLLAANTLQFTHALQIDADGQHNGDDVQRFLQVANIYPTALIAGHPVFDDSVPKARYYARYLSLWWVWINTLSMSVIDAMCGFRVYPVRASCKLIDEATMGDRMDFDLEFIVRWLWVGYPIKQLPTKVIYPRDGISHFRLWHDNLLISSMHARLFAGMLLRLPRLLARKLSARRGNNGDMDS